VTRWRTIGAAVGAAAMMLAGVIGAAGAPLTWVSGTGADAGACPITAPCATLQYAHDQTDAGGMIAVLKSGAFGKLQITKSISVVAEGVEARVSGTVAGVAFCASSICINAGANDVIYLRGLLIDRSKDTDAATYPGMTVKSAGSVYVENCRFITGQTGVNVGFNSPIRFYMGDSIVTGTSLGIFADVRSSGASAKIVLNRVQSFRNTYGMRFLGSAAANSLTATVRDSVFAHNSIGLSVAITGAGTGSVALDGVTLAHNSTYGVDAFGPGTVRIGNSTVTNSGSKGLRASSGASILQYPGNRIDGNADDPTEVLRNRR
jgi:hypothetical protein